MDFVFWTCLLAAQELVITIKSILDRVGADCRVRAQSQDRVAVDVRDLPCFGRPARLVLIKRWWRCREGLCDAKTWTELSEHVDTQAVITRRAGVEACRHLGQLARPVSRVAQEFGVCWWTVMNAVIEEGTPLVDHPDRMGAVAQLGVDETSFLAGKHNHSTRYATRMVDLSKRIMIDMVEGNSAADLRKWTANADPTGPPSARTSNLQPIPVTDRLKITTSSTLSARLHTIVLDIEDTPIVAGDNHRISRVNYFADRGREGQEWDESFP